MPTKKTGARKSLAWRLIRIPLYLAVLYELWLFGQVVWYAYRPPGETAVMRQELQRLREIDPQARLRRAWTPYERISGSLKRAVVASEDANFLEHDGIEWDAIREAWEYNRQQQARGSGARRGGSTIPQQLAKNLFLSNARNYPRKVQELALAYMIEAVMPKRRILELYLNVAEWGVGVFGAEAAARHYYQTGAAGLSAAQAARLAAMLPSPRYYDRHRDTRYLNSRAATIAARMKQADIP
jgi:monofunctional biosynthetic peptidoglycan transglycosylase